MEVNNQTSDPVEWEQNGGTPLPEDAQLASQEGQLNGQSATGQISPVGTSPYEVHFTSIGLKPEKSAKSPEFTNSNATVTLNDNWTVTVS